MADTGNFQINDILLTIAPETIKISHKSFNNDWQTLRTRSSTTTKSGFSQIAIEITVPFTDSNYDHSEINGFDKLLDLVSQLRVTPFCYVENEYLRNNIVGGSHEKAMALALQQMTLQKEAGTTNVIYVTFNFLWFNYFPFIKDFTFKRDIFDNVEEKNPVRSRAWELLYKAEQKREQYEPIGPFLQGATVLEYTEYAIIEVVNYQKLKKELSALNTLADEIVGASEFNASTSNIQRILSKELNDQRWGVTLFKEIVGNQTSFGSDMNTSEEAITRLLNLVELKTKDSKYDLLDDSWKVTLTNTNEPIKFAADITRTDRDLNEKFQNKEMYTLQRPRLLNLDEEGLIVDNVVISFQNILATIPIIGYPYPTFQHIGSIDAIISMSITTTSEEAEQKLTNFWLMIEDQAHRFRQLPQGFRNVKLTNKIVNMCGIRYLITEGRSAATIPGQPGTSKINLEFRNNPLTPNTEETFQAGQSFTTSNDIRVKIAKILEKWVTLSGFYKPSFDFGNTTLKLVFPLSSSTFTSSPTSGKSFYKFTGDIQRQARLESLAKQYGDSLSNLIVELVPLIQTAQGSPTPGGVGKGLWTQQSAKELITNIFTLRDTDVIGIERIQQDLYPVIKNNDKLNQFFPAATTPEALRDLAAEEKKSQLTNLVNQQRQVVSDNQAIQDTVLSATDIIDEAKSSLANFIRNNLYDFQRNNIKLLDSILLSGDIDLPEFSTVKQYLLQRGLANSGDAYPDFPLQQVLGLLEESQDPSLVSSYNKLKDLYIAQGLQNKNVGLSSLINPDFYFYTPQEDLIQDLIPGYVINKARSSIIDARKQMEGVEGDWFLKVYEGKQGIGSSKATRVLIDTQKAINSDPVYKTDVGKIYAAQLTQSIKNGMAPNELTGSVLPSIQQSLQSGKAEDLITLNKIGATGTTDPKDKIYDAQNVFSNYRNPTTLQPVDTKNSIVHFFDTENVLSILPESSYITASINNSSTVPQFDWPVPSFAQHITSYFGPRISPIPGASTFHKGIDLASIGNSEGVDVLAAADGTISHVAFSENQSAPNKTHGHEGVTISIEHGNGFKTNYYHLQWNKDIEQLSNAFWGKNGGELLSTNERTNLITTYRGTKIANIGHTGLGTGPHLHFEIWENNEVKDPLTFLDQNTIPSSGPLNGIETQNESLLSKSIDQFKKELLAHQGYSMNRAYPTFKLYFIKTDTGERIRYSFDNFFAYNAVQDIELVRSRKIAASMLMMKLTNVSGTLSNRKFQSARDPTVALDQYGNKVTNKPYGQQTNTINETPIASLLLQPGVQIQLRLGFDNQPENLDQIFNGVITEVEFSEASDLVTISAQDYAIELVQTIQGEVKDFGGWFSGNGRTHKIIEELLAYPEVVHFGRWEGNNYGLNTQRGLLVDRWKAIDTPADDNVFAPMGGTGIGIIDEFCKTTKYRMYQTTLWDVIQEMTLRHPSYIAQAVPYMGKNNDARMTLFFGLPDQLYFARDSSYLEDATISTLQKIVNTEKMDEQGETAYKRLKATAPLSSSEFSAFTQNKLQITSKDEWFKNFARRYGLEAGFIKPFRGYHVVTSRQHIVMNNINASAYNTFNTVTVQYGKKPAEIDKNTAELTFGDSDTFTLKGDEAIPDEEVRELLVQYPNCIGQEMAKRYALTLLANSFKQSYKGSLVILGNPGIKENDIVYIFDEYSDMYGPVEVDTVVHRFSQQTGFITEITPSLCVHVNQHSTMSTQDAMGLVAEYGMKKIGLDTATIYDNNLAAAPLKMLNSTASAISTAFFSASENVLDQSPNSAFGMIGTFIFSKLITRTQLAHPVRFSPLVLNGYPMIGGLPNRRTDGSFIQQLGIWKKDFNEGLPLLIQDTRDKLQPGYWTKGLAPGNLKDYLIGS
jgi:murein DD-endopeptidase MepM/ murein hydrolase activator NlpD